MRVEFMKRQIGARGDQRARRAHSFAGAIMLACVALLTGCGQTTGSTSASATATATMPPTATPTDTATPTPTSAPTTTTCLPDTYGIYASQPDYVTMLSDAPLSAPPQTKHGIGSSGNNATITSGGESGVCTIGAFTTVTAYYNHLLPTLGWQLSAPPTAIDACFHGSIPAKAWWKGSDTFSWYDGGDAGGGSIFWSYTYCSAHG